MKKLYRAAVFYLILGLAAGLSFREYTKIHDFTGYSELNVLHTHALTLGMIIMLITLALEGVFTLSQSKWFNLFYWHYNGGVVLTLAMMLVIGLKQVAGESSSAMLDGIAGLGHIIITAGLIFFFMALSQSLKTKSISRDASVK